MRRDAKVTGKLKHLKFHIKFMADLAAAAARTLAYDLGVATGSRAGDSATGAAMPSLEPDGEKLASLRRALGMTQLELALRAGVSERTIRNSERSRPINHAFLGYIAGALGLSVAEITRPSGELARHARWMKNCATFLTGLQHSMLDRDAKPLAEHLHRNFELHQLGGVPGVETLRFFMGEYRGVSDFDRFVDNTQLFWEKDPGGAVTIEAPKGDAETLLVRGYHELQQADGGIAWGRYTYVVDFEGEVIRNVTATIVPCAPPAEVPGILSAGG